MSFLNGLKDISYAALRIVSGYLFLWHGTQKFFDFPKPGPENLNLMLQVGGAIEIVGGILLIIGLFTRLSAFICSGTMAVAYWVFHAPHANPAFPILNNGELSVMFCFVFLYIACQGPGILSLDKR